MPNRLFMTSCMATLTVFGMAAQSGSWKGDLKIGSTTLPILFNFSAEGCTLDSPAQGAKGIPAKWTPDGSGKVSVQIPVINGSFEGKLTGDSIPGKFTQHGYSVPLTLRPGEVKLNRPQTPKPPYPYTTEEVSFKNDDAILSGTLTLPENYTKNTPALVMVTGSGLQNRDEEAFGHKPFAVIADALARQGIATLRYDDRGFGESSGDVINSTIDDFMNDAAAGVGLLRKRFKHVGVLGHSEGGTIAMMLASDKAVDFAISLAGMTVSGKELLLRQNRDALAGMGLSSDVVDTYCKHLSDGMDAVIAGKDPEPINDTQLPAALNQNLNKALQQFATPYMRSFIRFSAKDNLAKTSVPLLALNGTKDTQVDYVNNLAAVKSLASSKPFTVKSYEGLNHFFQHAETGSVDEYGKIEETISPEVLSDIIAWIKALKTK